MLIYPHINPIAFSIGPLHIHWYAVMYLVAFALVFLLGRYRIQRQPGWGLTNEDMESLLSYGMFGTILGGRIGYALFYQPHYYLSHPLEVLAVWQGGMSFHGGLLGVTIGLWLFARTRGKPFLLITDFIAPLVPLGLAAGRMGNFINGELWGRPTSLPWGMVFPYVDRLPRHPSQLYEFALEGLLLFVILWLYSRKPRPMGAISGLFLVSYGTVRFLVEYTREPDAFLGLLALGLSMGQWLSIPLVAAGFLLIFWAYRSTHRRRMAAGSESCDEGKPYPSD